jgi:hypothetical protein
MECRQRSAVRAHGPHKPGFLAGEDSASTDPDYHPALFPLASPGKAALLWHNATHVTSIAADLTAGGHVTEDRKKEEPACGSRHPGVAGFSLQFG